VHAVAAAGGCQLVASCDLVIAAESATFSIPGIKRGLFCHTPLVAVSRNVGAKRALEMAFTGDPVPAATAAEWGLINYAVPDDELDRAVDRLIHRIIDDGSPYARGLGKKLFYAQSGLTQASAYDLATEMVALNAVLPDAQEGFASFTEKREPVYQMLPNG
jgi:enoyl-CoA hydratase/carnithine racemase